VYDVVIECFVGRATAKKVAFGNQLMFHVCAPSWPVRRARPGPRTSRCAARTLVCSAADVPRRCSWSSPIATVEPGGGIGTDASTGGKRKSWARRSWARA
jgi:hypothetical protein